MIASLLKYGVLHRGFLQLVVTPSMIESYVARYSNSPKVILSLCMLRARPSGGKAEIVINGIP